MGRMKDSFVGPRGIIAPSRGRGADWNNVSPHRRCPVCGGDSWCQVSRDGSAVLCKRVASDREKVNREGVTFYVHNPDGAAPAAPRVPSAPRHDRAPVDVCDRAYRAVLAELRLNEGDRTGLHGRGLSDEDIATNGYRTLPVEGRARLALVMVNAVGEDAAQAVPGFVWKTEGNRGRWSLAGAAGLAIPVRDIEGRIVALKIRRRDPCEGPRYLCVSSSKYGGPSAPSAVHVPLAAAARRETAPRLVITEGELKADVATALSSSAVVSIPGVGSWAAGVDLALAWGVRDVAVALDMDFATNRFVAKARALIVDELRREGLRALLWKWDSRWKGIDDFLAARRRGEVDDARR